MQQNYSVSYNHQPHHATLVLDATEIFALTSPIIDPYKDYAREADYQDYFYGDYAEKYRPPVTYAVILEHLACAGVHIKIPEMVAFESTLRSLNGKALKPKATLPMFQNANSFIQRVRNEQIPNIEIIPNTQPENLNYIDALEKIERETSRNHKRWKDTLKALKEKNTHNKQHGGEKEALAYIQVLNEKKTPQPVYFMSSDLNAYNQLNIYAAHTKDGRAVNMVNWATVVQAIWNNGGMKQLGFHHEHTAERYLEDIKNARNASIHETFPNDPPNTSDLQKIIPIPKAGMAFQEAKFSGNDYKYRMAFADVYAKIPTAHKKKFVEMISSAMPQRYQRWA